MRDVGGHVSWNANRRDSRLVTLRAPRVGRARAETRFTALLGAIARSGFVARRPVREYTVLDSNAAFDAGWIES